MNATTSGNGTIESGVLIRRGAIALALSLVVNWIVLQAVLVGDLVEPFEPLEFPSVTSLTALGALGATAVYAAISRFADDPNRTFTTVAVIVLGLSFIPDLALLEVDPAATVPAVVVLMVMHVTVATICIVVLTGRVSPFSG